MNYRQIQPLAWRINPDLCELPFAYEELKFPTDWGETLRRLIADKQKRDPLKTELPIRDLNKALRALVPGLISIEKKASSANSTTWLRNTEQAITPETLRLIMYWWAIYSSKTPDGNRVEDVAGQLTADQLVWTRKQLDLAKWVTHANNTAKAADSAVYNIIPDLISSRLSANGVEFDLHARPLRFYRVPISPGASGAELISWPPINLIIGKATYYFSVLATITLQTIPFQPFPEIYIDLGIRRWVSGRTDIPRRDATSVYLRTAVPWISGIQQSDCFQVAQLRWRRDGRGLEWASQLTKILNQVAPERLLPDPQTIAADPVPAMNVDSIPNTAIVYREAMRRKHQVAAGLMPADRVPLARQIADVLAPEFVQLGSLSLVARPKVHKNFFTTKATEQALAQRRQSLATLTNGTLSLNVYYQMDGTRDALITEVCQMLDVPVPENLPVVIEAGGLSVEINAQEIGRIGAGLEIDARRGKQQAEAYRAAVEQRIDLICRQVPHTTKPAIVFAEIQRAEQYEQRSGEADPKHAIRNGLAIAGYLSQFTVLDSENPIKERAKRALLDGLRQLGAHRGSAAVPLLPQPWNCAGIWLIRQSAKKSFSGTQQFIPVAVNISAQNGRVYATASGIRGWLPYPDMLLRIAHGEVRRYDRPAQALSFIRQFVRDEVSADGDALLLCDSQNLRDAWVWLRDTNLNPDTLLFGDVSSPITDHPGLRLVRVRSEANHETPEWYAYNDTNEGFSAGLFRISERVFASTSAKPVQFSGTSVNASILNSPTMAAWNPVLYELTVAAMQPGDNPAKIAEYAHSLRLAAVQYEEATALPLPLHLAKLMEEYVLTFDSENEEGEDFD